MMYLLGVSGIMLGVALSIALHEVGHLLPAKLFGVRVPQYMVGFGPTLWSTRRGETEYGVKAIPLGGYVQMIGMYPPKAPGTGRFTWLADAARDRSLAELEPGDESRVFYALSAPRKAVIALGGPTMNLLIAVLVFTGLYTLHGVARISPVLSTVAVCVDVHGPGKSLTATCTPDMPRSPAALAGLESGDRVVSINGTVLTTWDDAVPLVRANADTPITLVVDRDGRTLTLTATPMAVSVPIYDENGQPRSDGNGAVLTEQAGFLGASGIRETVKQPITAVPGLIAAQIGQTIKAVLGAPQKMGGVVATVFTGRPRDAGGPISVVGVGRLGGEVASAGAIGATDKAVVLIDMLGSLNLALFFLNLIPLPPLDGGHVAGAL